MAVTYTWDESARILVWSSSDPVAIPEWHAAMDRARNDPVLRRELPIRVVVDLTGRETFNEGSMVRDMALSLRDRLVSPTGSRMRIAVIAPTPLAHGIARLAESYAQGIAEIQIFPTAQEARQWLSATITVPNAP